VEDLFIFLFLFRCSFSSGEACTEWQRRITRAATQPRVLEKVFALAFFAWANDEADDDDWSKLGGRSEGPTDPGLVGSVEASDQNFHAEVPCVLTFYLFYYYLFTYLKLTFIENINFIDCEIGL
jgi:hypothetical protein